MAYFKALLILILIAFLPFGFCRETQNGRHKQSKRSSSSTQSYQQIINPIKNTPGSKHASVFRQVRDIVTGPNQPSSTTAVRTNGFVTIPARQPSNVLSPPVPYQQPYQQTEINYVGVGPDGSPVLSIRPVAAQAQILPQPQVQNYPIPNSQNYAQNQGQVIPQPQGQAYPQTQTQVYSQNQGQVLPKSQSQTKPKSQTQRFVPQRKTPRALLASKSRPTQFIPSWINTYGPIYLGPQPVPSYNRQTYPYSKYPLDKQAKLGSLIKQVSYY